MHNMVFILDDVKTNSLKSDLVSCQRGKTIIMIIMKPEMMVCPEKPIIIIQ